MQIGVSVGRTDLRQDLKMTHTILIEPVAAVSTDHYTVTDSYKDVKIQHLQKHVNHIQRGLSPIDA